MVCSGFEPRIGGPNILRFSKFELTFYFGAFLTDFTYLGLNWQIHATGLAE